MTDGELQEQLIRFARYANGLTPYKLDEPLDPMVEGVIDDLARELQQAARLEADNNARNVLHGILSEDVDSELDHSDIEAIFVKRLAPERQDSEGGL